MRSNLLEKERPKQIKKFFKPLENLRKKTELHKVLLLERWCSISSKKVIRFRFYLKAGIITVFSETLESLIIY